MKLIVVSDNHGRKKQLDTILNKHVDADYFIHLGDSEMEVDDLKGYIAVRGNNDYNGLKRFEILTLKNHQILITHGHGYFYGDNRDALIDIAKSYNCNVVMFGHSHIFEYQVIDEIAFINPGSLHHNRDFTKPSYAIVEIDKDIKVEKIEF